MSTLTLEQLYDNLQKIDAKLSKFTASEDEKEDEKEAKKAALKKAEDEEKQEEKKEAKKAALKKAMEEEDDEKRDAAIRKAMKIGESEEDDAETDPKEAKTASRINSIINDKKNDLINKILTANKIFNPTGLKQVEARLKTASIEDVEKEYEIVAPFTASAPQVTAQPEKIIPYFANFTNTKTDDLLLTASSPDSDFAKFTTKELLEMTQ